jgi:DNA-directed RNA polymerase subunit RPC12/RpoP
MAEETEETVEDQVDESIEVEEENEETGPTGYVCVKCEEEVEVDPVEDKIICPSCSHRVLLKKRPEQGKTVEAV